MHTLNNFNIIILIIKKSLKFSTLQTFGRIYWSPLKIYFIRNFRVSLINTFREKLHTVLFYINWNNKNEFISSKLRHSFIRGNLILAIFFKKQLSQNSISKMWFAIFYSQKYQRYYEFCLYFNSLNKTMKMSHSNRNHAYLR